MASARALNVSSRAGNAHFQTKKNTIAKANIPATSSDVAGNNSSKPEELSSASAKKVSKFIIIPYSYTKKNKTKPISANASVKAIPKNIVVLTIPAASGCLAIA